MQKQPIIELLENRHIKFRALTVKSNCLVDDKLLKGCMMFREFLQSLKGLIGRRRYLVIAERDGIPQSPYRDISYIKENDLANLDRLAAEAAAMEISKIDQLNSNYIMAITLRFAVIGIIFAFILIAILVAAGTIDISAMTENWLKAFQR